MPSLPPDGPIPPVATPQLLALVLRQAVTAMAAVAWACTGIERIDADRCEQILAHARRVETRLADDDPRLASFDRFAFTVPPAGGREPVLTIAMPDEAALFLLTADLRWSFGRWLQGLCAACEAAPAPTGAQVADLDAALTEGAQAAAAGFIPHWAVDEQGRPVVRLERRGQPWPGGALWTGTGSPA